MDDKNTRLATLQPHEFQPSAGSTRCAIPGCGSPRLALIHAAQRDPLAEVVIEALRERVGAFHEQLLAAGFSDPAPAQIGVIVEERDKLRAEVERLRAEVERLAAFGRRDTAFQEALMKQRNALVDAVLPLMEKNGHFYDCLPGKRGTAPGESCSVVCQKLRAALRKAGRP